MQPKPSMKIRTTSLESFMNSAEIIRVSSIMTPRSEFEYCKPHDLLDEKLEMMKRQRFDAIPMLRGKSLKTGKILHYLDRKTIEQKMIQGCKYCKDAAIEISQEDLVNDLPLGEILHRFSSRTNKPKIPIFVINPDNQIIGLITLADFDKTAVKMYLFCLISELELSLLKIISKHYKRLKGICTCNYCLEKGKKRESQNFCEDSLEEYYYLCLKELFHMIVKSENIGLIQERIKRMLTLSDCDSIVELRNAISHPKPLVSGKFPIDRLEKIHGLIKNLTLISKSTPKQHQTKVTVYIKDQEQKISILIP